VANLGDCPYGLILNLLTCINTSPGRMDDSRATANKSAPSCRNSRQKENSATRLLQMRVFTRAAMNQWNLVRACLLQTENPRLTYVAIGGRSTATKLTNGVGKRATASNNLGQLSKPNKNVSVFRPIIWSNQRQDPAN
jgi:hypothetical protein